MKQDFFNYDEDFFKVRQLTLEENEHIITVGNMLATRKRFQSREAAEEYIKSKPYDLIFTLAVAASKAVLTEKEETKS